MLLTNVSKTWAMPNGKTFKIKPIRELIEKYAEITWQEQEEKQIIVLDPFANEASIRSVFDDSKYRYISNDIDTDFTTDYHLHAPEFLKLFSENSVSLVLQDSPYSFRQVSECYKKLKMTVTARDTSNAFFSDFKDITAKIVKKGGYVISFGWNSNGMGASRGFEQKEILLVAYGSNHNDTICTVEKKIK